MRSTHFRRPSPAMVLAFAALLVALGGTSYAAITLPANSVGTKQLKKNAVNSAKVKNRSLRAVDFATGQLPRGPQGAQGAQGAQGPQGPAGPTNVTVRQGAFSTNASADCQPGERAVGGGAFSTQGVLYLSAPNADTGTPTGWEAGAVDVNADPVPAQAWVICVSP
jgi:hypothetical protein